MSGGLNFARPAPPAAAAVAAIFVALATLVPYIDGSPALYSPFTVQFTHLQRPDLAPAIDSQPSAQPQAQARRPVRTSVGDAKLYGQLFVPNIAAEEQMPLMMVKREAPLRAGYGWEQCEFSPLSCLLRRRRK